MQNKTLNGREGIKMAIYGRLLDWVHLLFRLKF